MKKHRLRKICIILLLLLAYACAIVLPYSRQPAVTADTMEQFSASGFYGNTDTCERAMVISDNGEALAERIRLISQAEDEIILSTFDFNADVSGRMLLAALYQAAGRGVHVSILVDGISYATGILGNSQCH
nr:phospholipase D-like domain-containing protein [uncultured Acetatifactor sp.]